MQPLSSQIAEIYSQLVPPMDEGLLIFKLHEKIKSGAIDPNFSSQDLQRTIEELYRETLVTETLPNRERLLKNLLMYFIERPADLTNRYSLTDYARKFILLVEHKINYPFRKFPLRESFRRYTDFTADDINHINQFESWFNQGFQATTKENILDHLEELKMQVQRSVQDLNKLLYSSDESAQKIVTDFSVIFTDLGEKADEIRDTLRLGNTLQQQIDRVVEKFYEVTTALPHPITAEELTHFNELQYGFNRASEIQQEVLAFFDIIDAKLAQLRERIQYATTKLNELQHLFKYKSQFRVNIRRLLEYILTEATYEKNLLVLADDFPRKGIPEERFKLTVMPDLAMQQAQQNIVIDNPPDHEYHLQELQQIEHELTRQQRTAILVEGYLAQLQEAGSIDFTEEFYKIITQEDDEEIALQVSYDLIQFAHLSLNHEVRISPKITDNFANQPIKTWNITLMKKI